MKKRVAFLVGSLMLIPTPAFADHEYGRDNCENGGCGQREEDYEGAGCKYVCPSFDKSPVQDAFNITICVQPGSCSGGEDGSGQGGEAPPEEAPAR